MVVVVVVCSCSGSCSCSGCGGGGSSSSSSSNIILVKEHFSFRAKISTEAVPYSFIAEILSAVNNKNLNGGIFCDLTKALDCINHGTLLSKLRYYGITGTFYSLMTSYIHVVV